MIIALIATLYALAIAIFDTELGILFGTIFLVSMIITNKLSQVTGLDKKIDEFLEKD